MRMSRLVTSLLALLAVLALTTGCTGQDTSSAPEESSSSVVEESLPEGMPMEVPSEEQPGEASGDPSSSQPATPPAASVQPGPDEDLGIPTETPMPIETPPSEGSSSAAE